MEQIQTGAMRQYSFIFRIVEVIEARLPDKLDIDRLSSDLNVSRWHLQHEFKRYTGFSVGRYYRLRLLTLATDEIATTERRIIDIALDYGFESQEALYRAIKNNFQISPKHFRRDLTLARYLSMPPIDIRYLDFYQHMEKHPPFEMTFPETQLTGIKDNFCSVFLDEKETVDKVERLWQDFSQSFNHWDHTNRRYYTLEYRNNCSYRSGQFQMMAMCTGEAESTDRELSKVVLSDRKVWRFSFPYGDQIPALWIYLTLVFTYHKKLSLSRLPYIWALDEDGSMVFWIELQPSMNNDSLPESIESLSTTAITLTAKQGKIQSYRVPDSLVLKSQRLAYLLDQFRDKLPQINEGQGYLLIGEIGPCEYTPEHDYHIHHFTTSESGDSELGEGQYLKCYLTGSLEKIGEDLDSLYYSYLSDSRYYLRQGNEWITYAEEKPGQEWGIELLIPVTKR